MPQLQERTDVHAKIQKYIFENYGLNIHEGTKQDIDENTTIYNLDAILPNDDDELRPYFIINIGQLKIKNKRIVKLINANTIETNIKKRMSEMGISLDVNN
jgi:hypothetical protein